MDESRTSSTTIGDFQVCITKGLCIHVHRFMDESQKYARTHTRFLSPLLPFPHPAAKRQRGRGKGMTEGGREGGRVIGR